ncbi:unnamed protein product [Psylliodes chrysocephalus]|uniref:NUC153 domain-containing protein n=1 Tax=Psylliodes chrysocephalus TaxID=3402493 RepID=A0A9P0DAW1_9CUCU|nr:unnamed protein product [Psylliodes chrysocephala]
MEDNRFSHIKTDPKFRRISKKERKVKIDKRFQSMFNDKKFKVKYTTDKRGRPVNHTSNEDLKRYYELSSESNSSDSESENEESEDIGKHVKKSEEIRKQVKKSEEIGKNIKKSAKINELEEKDISDKALPVNVKKKLKDLSVDYARGESKLLSESSSDDEESEEEISESEDIDHKWGELDAEAEQTEEATHRLAACNMDWDRIRALDLMVLFNSFLPPGGIIKSVAIYPSEFGKQRIKEEEIKGPTELVDPNTEELKDEDDNEEGSNYHMEKLRQYQLNRLKYYYAIISFDNVNSANKIYTECDGMEYESSAIKLDLRFVPDSMEFDDEPKEICDKLPEVNKYQPRFFTNTALQQAKVDLTWDETDPNRIEVTQKLSTGKIDELTKEDLQNYLASSSEEDSEKETEELEDFEEERGSKEDMINKYKALLQDIESKEKSEKDKDVEMEISWGINLKNKTEKLVKDKSNQDMTPFEQYLEKKKEKRKEKKKQKKEQDDDSDMPSDIDINDPYFAEELNNPEFKKPKKQTDKLEEDDDEQKQKELELLLMNNDDDENKKHFSLKKIQESESTKKKKWKNKKKDTEEWAEDNFKVNINDDRFSALFTSHLYNIDPTDPNFKKTKGMETLVSEKLKRRLENGNESIKVKKVKTDKKRNAELSTLVKSVKRKATEYMNK